MSIDTERAIEYAMWWLEHANKAFAENPRRGVHHWTHVNYSGGRTGWEEEMSQVYFSPRSLEERLLQSQVHEAILMALGWAFREAETKTPDRWSAWDGAALAEAYRLSHMAAKADPLLACALKVRLDKICRRMGKTLAGLADRNFEMFTGPTGISW